MFGVKPRDPKNQGQRQHTDQLVSGAHGHSSVESVLANDASSLVLVPLVPPHASELESASYLMIKGTGAKRRRWLPKRKRLMQAGQVVAATIVVVPTAAIIVIAISEVAPPPAAMAVVVIVPMTMMISPSPARTIIVVANFL